jgi:hypothetical protein
MLYDSLRSLKHPRAVQSSSLYLPVISTILWQLWVSYFNHGTDTVFPVADETLDKLAYKITSHITQLVHPNIPFD